MKYAPRFVPVLLSMLLATPALAENTIVRFTTVLGNFDVELCTEMSDACPGVAPNTVANFLRYVDEGVYPATMFIHRRGAGGNSPLVLQGGGYFLNASNVSTAVPLFAPIALELGENLSNLRGTIAMARQPGPDTATSQWFINLVDNVSLDTAGGGYAVFGKVVSGLDAVDAVGALTIYFFSSTFSEVPLRDGYPGSGPAKDFLVYVPEITRVPEPASFAAACGASLALCALASRRRG